MVTDAELEHLSGLTNIQSLGLDSSQITDSGLGNLKGLTRLETLVLSGNQITDAGLENVKGLTPFGSVDCNPEDATPIALNELRQSNIVGYRHGYRSGCPELTAADGDCRQLAKWLADAWPHLTAEIRDQIILLIENCTSTSKRRCPESDSTI